MSPAAAHNPVDIDFRKYGLLAVFYKGHSAGFDPEAQSVEESAAGELSVRTRSRRRDDLLRQ